MGELTVKLSDTQLVEALTEMAKVRRHSVDDEVADAVRRAVEAHEYKLKLLHDVDAIAAMTPKGGKQSDTLQLLREDRTR